MTSAYFFLPDTYDFQQATLVQGALDAGLQVVGSVASNYCAVERPVTDWLDLHDFNYIFYCERTISHVLRLTGKVAQSTIVFVDGGDTQKIVWPLKAVASQRFKREFPLTLVGQCPGIKGVGFGVENRYVHEFKPFLEREYLLSCMLRLDTNSFRKGLQGAVDILKETFGSKIFNGSTGEISYTGTSPIPQATPKYSRILSNSCLSVSCHGAGQDTGRFWEILGAGCFLFSQRLSIAIHDLPQDGEHCVYFQNEQDFLDKANYYLKHLDEAEGIARAGQAFALERASSRARFDYIIKSIENSAPHIPNWLELLHIANHNLRLSYMHQLTRMTRKIAGNAWIS